MNNERTAWVEVGRESDWQPWKSEERFVFEDANTLRRCWFNLDTGAGLLLIAEGGWRNAPESRMRLFHRSPAGEDVDLTSILERRAHNGGAYEDIGTGSDKYVQVWASCIDVVEHLLGLSESGEEQSVHVEASDPMRSQHRPGGLSQVLGSILGRRA